MPTWTLPPDFMRNIRDFNVKFDLQYDGDPRKLEEKLREFRIKFMQEELDEYKTAKSLEQELDALVDLVYVALGTAHMQGFDFNEAWERVQVANMRKIRAVHKDQSKRGSAFDVVKPEGWQPPDLSDLVMTQTEIEEGLRNAPS